MNPNAIILSAGLGSRFKELTQNNHKSLFDIDGTPNIERTIQYLLDANISDINIVVGHNHHLFQYLEEKYYCKLLYNEHYKTFNNLSSLLLAQDDFTNSYIIDGDIVLFKNIFLQKLQYSTYFTILRHNSHSLEWVPRVDKDNFIEKIDITDDNSPSLLGVSYWNSEDSFKIKQEIQKYNNLAFLENHKKYWDDIPRSIIHQLKVKTITLDTNDAGEMDNIDDYNNLIQQSIINKK